MGPAKHCAREDLVFDALGSSVRRQILEQLRGGERAVGELTITPPISRPAVSKHLAQLEQAGLVAYRECGTRNLYFVADQGFQTARDWLSDFWDDALLRYKLVAENLPERRKK